MELWSAAALCRFGPPRVAGIPSAVPTLTAQRAIRPRSLKRQSPRERYRTPGRLNDVSNMGLLTCAQGTRKR